MLPGFRPSINLLAGGVVALLANSTDVVAQNSFLSTDWTSGKNKTLYLPPGQIVGGTGNLQAALRIGTKPGGTLTIVIDGEVQGGGVADNGATGGDAIDAQGYDNIIIVNNGALRAAGGNGGKGGTGGQGYYVSTIQEGPYFQNSGALTLYQYSTAWSGLTKVIWFGSTLYDAWDGGRTSITLGAWTYHLGAWQYGENYAIRRTRPENVYTNGGLGGSIGRGRAYGVTRTNGTAGSAGGTNAGAGGLSGDGGDWGLSGTAGASGSNGNYTGGLAGQAAGLAGFSIRNGASAIYLGAGVRQGR